MTSAIDSLKNLTIHYVSYNLLNLSSKQQRLIIYLPNNIKNKILRKILCVSSVIVKLGPLLFNQLFRDLINRNTLELDLSNVAQIDLTLLKSLRNSTQAIHQLTFDGLTDDCLINDLKHTLKLLNHLHNLTITNSPIIQSDIVRVISEFAVDLDALDLRGCPNVNDACIYLLSGRLLKLRHVGLSRTAVSGEGVCALVQGRLGLRELAIGGCAKLQQMSLADRRVMMREIASNCPKLLYLHADHLPIDENDCFIKKKCTGCSDKDRGDANCKCNCSRIQQITFTVPF